ncbi:MAG: hypothetical protein WBB28_21390 [Crinalium sp.]
MIPTTIMATVLPTKIALSTQPSAIDLIGNYKLPIKPSAIG